MSLTIGRGPFGSNPAGRFNFDPPEAVVYVERFPRRVRAVREGRTVVDSEAVLMVHESGKLPRYAFPRADVLVDGDDEPHAGGYVNVPWDSVDRWFEEDEEVEVHPRDPYHRIDTFATSRRVTISIDGIALADSTGARALYETGLPTRYYLPPDDVRTDRLEPSDTVTRCAYKGTARHWSARVDGVRVADVAWRYDDVRAEGAPVRGLIAFYDERVDVDVDGVRQERPSTPWSHPG